MADPYGINARPSLIESDDMSSILHDILHYSSAPPSNSSLNSLKSKYLEAETSATAGLFSRSEDSDNRVRDGASASVLHSASSFNFSDPGDYFPIEVKDSTKNTCSMVGGLESNAITSMKGREDFKGLEASEVTVDPIPPRSSKRSRPLEVHNLSEKRRRSRINEKMKALQSLIPNSNKTDKASMLDDAIEYLKQLQLQVQMLTMRNGLNFHPTNLRGSLQPIQLPQMAMNFKEENGLLNMDRGADTFPGNQEIPRRTAFQILNHAAPSQPMVIPPLTNIMNLESSFCLETSIQTQYGVPNHLTSSKDIYRDDILSRLNLDISCSGHNSSPGVSS
ncbi:unnamed protein product [Ilex paraguariensis]|uniref:BHLH domain-containing protein n=1 Tax=Ilex paraguariensis TaxID=185542 RepID=A0ABC8UVI7_9AQUA